jgi:hypothetical protein
MDLENGYDEPSVAGRLQTLAVSPIQAKSGHLKKPNLGSHHSGIVCEELPGF